MNLFFSSFAMRAAKARPIPEEQPVMSTTFWFIVPGCLFVLQLQQQRMDQDKQGAGAGDVEALLKPILNPQVCDSAEALCTWPGDYHQAWSAHGANA